VPPLWGADRADSLEPHGSRFTWDFEELTAYLAQVTDKIRVTELMGISWTTVVNHDRRRVVWAAACRSADTLGGFFDELGEERGAQLDCVTMDVAGGYIKAVEERLPEAQIVFDRFQVQRLASDALDAVRRGQLREIRGSDAGQALFQSRFALLKDPWNLTREQKQKLSEVQRTNAPLYRAYLLKETLAQVLDCKQLARAERALRDVLPALGRYRGLAWSVRRAGDDALSSSIRRALDTDEQRLFEEPLPPAQASRFRRILHRRLVSDIRHV
jgi:hypothetical protein